MNPFVYGHPLGKNDHLYGREKLLSRLDQMVSDKEHYKPLLLFGPEGIGKTSLLVHFLMSRIQRHSPGTLVDTRTLIGFNLQDFLWRTSQAINRALKQLSIPTPPLQKRSLVLRPEHEFRKLFWLPLLETLGDRRLIVALDDAEQLLSGSPSGEQHRNIIETLQRLDEMSPKVIIFFVCTDLPDQWPPERTLYLKEIRTIELRPFAPETSAQVLRQIEPPYVADETAAYIHSLTGGHPQDLQRLGHALYERSAQLGIRQITIADVMAELATNLSPADFSSAVYRRREDARLEL